MGPIYVKELDRRDWMGPIYVSELDPNIKQNTLFMNELLTECKNKLESSKIVL